MNLGSLLYIDMSTDEKMDDQFNVLVALVNKTIESLGNKKTVDAGHQSL